MTNKEIAAAGESERTAFRSKWMAWFECDAQTADRLYAVYARGRSHGMCGYYPDGDYASDADWYYGVGAEIQSLECLLGDDSNEVFCIYMSGHSHGLALTTPHESEESKC